jgi:hypothetical protein
MMNAMSAPRIALLVAAIIGFVLIAASVAGYLPRTAGVIVAVVAVVLFLVLSWRSDRKP